MSVPEIETDDAVGYEEGAMAAVGELYVEDPVGGGTDAIGVTRNSRNLPTSLEKRVYVLAVAPVMPVYVPFVVVASSQWNVELASAK